MPEPSGFGAAIGRPHLIVRGRTTPESKPKPVSKVNVLHTEFHQTSTGNRSPNRIANSARTCGQNVAVLRHFRLIFRSCTSLITPLRYRPPGVAQSYLSPSGPVLDVA